MNSYVITFCALLGMASSVDVIIIGSGMSGLGAARKLVNAGGHSVTVLEAKGRVGGRTWTDLSAYDGAVGTEVDKGASWIHGVHAEHPLKQLADKFGLETYTTSTRAVYNGTDGEDIIDEAQGNFVKLLGAILREYGDADMSVWDAITGMGLEPLAAEPEVATLIAELEFGAATTIDNMSLTFVYDFVKARQKSRLLNNTEELLIVDGYRGIVNGLIEGVNGETPITIGGSSSPRIMLNSPVASIEHDTDINQNTWVKVTTTDNTVYEADFVIVTVPLGVLKAGDGISFIPALSSEKQAAIEAVGFGNANKLIMNFENSFWDASDDKHSFFITNDDFSQRGMATYYLNTKPAVNRNTLVTYMIGPNADSSESMTDEQLKEKALAQLQKKFTIPANLQNPTVSRTQWKSDPYTRGCYTSFAVGSRVEHIEELGRAECPLFFAGEHTSKDNWATTTGAYASGLRAAEEVIAASREGSKSPSSAATELLHKNIYYVLLAYFIMFLLYLF